MKYKVGDKIRLKGTDSAGTVIDIIIRNQLLIILSDGSKIVEWPENVVLIEGLVEEEEIGFTEEDKYWCDIMSESAPNTYVLPEGYQFVDENGNIINATKIVLEKKKKEYPKTYKECCKVLGIEGNLLLIGTKYITDYERGLWNLMGQLHGLIICRDAYWKIAGEEMGLGKPWKPNLINGLAYTIQNNRNEIGKSYSAYGNKVLMFPTEEMRDAFYENFKELIEQCKELL